MNRGCNSRLLGRELPLNLNPPTYFVLLSLRAFTALTFRTMMAYQPQHPHTLGSAIDSQRNQNGLYSNVSLARSFSLAGRLPIGETAATVSALDVFGHYPSPAIMCLPQMSDHLLLRSVASARMRAQQDIQRLFRLSVAPPVTVVHTNPPSVVQAATQGLDLLQQAISAPDLRSRSKGPAKDQAAAFTKFDSEHRSLHRNAEQICDVVEIEKSGTPRLYITRILDTDVLCGRGGLSNHHPGNKRFRRVVNEMKNTYRTTEAKNLKTDLSRAIVEHVCGYGGRFIRKDEKKGRYHVLTKAEARRKTSQALRETKELKWTV